MYVPLEIEINEHHRVVCYCNVHASVSIVYVSTQPVGSDGQEETVISVTVTGGCQIVHIARRGYGGPPQRDELTAAICRVNPALNSSFPTSKGINLSRKESDRQDENQDRHGTDRSQDTSHNPTVFQYQFSMLYCNGGS